MFQRILVPLDGSARAERALPVAAHLALVSRGSIILFQAISPPTDYGGSLAPVPMLTEHLIETETAEATSYLTTVAQSVMLAGIKTQLGVQFGMPVQRILDEVEAAAADLVVLCSHGRTGFTCWILGSVALRIIHHSSTPVLVLREGGPTLSVVHAGAACALRAVVALDGSPLAEAALLPAAHLVAALAAPFQGELHFMHVVKPLTSTTDESVPPQHDARAVEQAEAYLAAVRERLLKRTSGLNLQVTWSVTQAQDVAETILTVAEGREESSGKNACDVLVMATHGRGGLERWVMGSITERVLQATKLPMLVVRPSQTRSYQGKES